MSLLRLFLSHACTVALPESGLLASALAYRPAAKHQG